MNTNQLKDEINAYIDKLYQAPEYIEFKKRDAFLYEDKELLYLINQKKEYERDFSYLTRESEEYQSKLKEYQSLMNKINEFESVIAYYKTYQIFENLKDIFEKELLIKLYA